MYSLRDHACGHAVHAIEGSVHPTTIGFAALSNDAPPFMSSWEVDESGRGSIRHTVARVRFPASPCGTAIIFATLDFGTICVNSRWLHVIAGLGGRSIVRFFNDIPKVIKTIQLPTSFGIEIQSGTVLIVGFGATGTAFSNRLWVCSRMRVN